MPLQICSNRGGPGNFSNTNGATLSIQQWDAHHYNREFAFVWEYGSGVLELLQAKPDERILDLGCGTGHLTNQIADSGSTVIGIDHSAEMIAAARQSYPSIEFHQMDGSKFSFDEPFDAVFSNATLHWIHPPEAAADCIRRALKPGGRLVAEFGGHRNVGQVVNALTTELALHGYPEAMSRNPWYFPSIAEYTALLERLGMEPVFARLNDRPTLLDGGYEGLASWLSMFGDSFFEGVPDDERSRICEAVAQRLQPDLFRDGNWYADYRRLQIVAMRW
jgi:trans-aconitate methyltransferase